MAAELPQPGVEILQEFRSTSPTILTPTLVPCIVGVAKQIVDLLVDDGSGTSSLNTDAIVTMPGFFVASSGSGDPVVYGGLNGLVLAVTLNGGPLISTTFVDGGSGLTPATVVSQVLAAFTLAGVTVATAETVGDDTWQMRTIGVGEFQFIDIDAATDGAVASAFGLGIGKKYGGISSYNQRVVEVPQSAFPDPRGNLSELAIQNDTIQAFIGVGNGGFQEAFQDSAFLRNGEVDDPAVVTGSVDMNTLTLPANLAGTTLTLIVDGGAAQVVDFDTPGPTPTTPTLIVSYVLANTTGLTTAEDGSGFLVLTTVSKGAGASLEITGGTAAAVLGLAIALVESSSIEAIDDGNGDAVTSLVNFPGQDFTASPTQATIVGVGFATMSADSTLVISDGGQAQTIQFLNGDNLAAVILKIEAVVGSAAGGLIVASDSGGQLSLVHSAFGTDSIVDIIGGTALTDLGLAVSTTYATAPSLPEPGDELWIDGAFIANISVVAPGGVVSVLQVAAQLTISDNIGTFFFIEAKGLDGSDPLRPAADLEVDGNGAVILKHELLRNMPQGAAIDVVGAIFVT